MQGTQHIVQSEFGAFQARSVGFVHLASDDLALFSSLLRLRPRREGKRPSVLVFVTRERKAGWPVADWGSRGLITVRVWYLASYIAFVVYTTATWWW